MTNDMLGRSLPTVPFSMLHEALLLSPSWRGLSPTARDVWCWLDRLSSSQDTAWPSKAHLADLLGCDPRSVQRAISELRKTGYIEVTPRFSPTAGGASRQTSNLYTVTYSADAKALHLAYLGALSKGLKAHEARNHLVSTRGNVHSTRGGARLVTDGHGNRVPWRGTWEDTVEHTPRTDLSRGGGDTDVPPPRDRHDSPRKKDI